MNRRYDLDWLRVMAFGLLMLFHTGMLFSTWDWHVKNLETSAAFDHVMRFLHQWRMPLLFFISGSAVWFALERYSTGRFFLERHQRLLLPLVFGMLVVIPPQVYHERLYHDQQYASFGDFYPTIFTLGAYPRGNLSWHHLWYVPYIWTYSMLMLPLFVWLRSRAGRPWLDRAVQAMARPGMLFLAFIPAAVSDVLLRPLWPYDANNLTGDWANFVHKLTFFVAGFVLASGPQVYDQLAAHRRKFLLAGVVSLGPLEWLWLTDRDFSAAGVAAGRVFNNFFIWMWLLAALGYGRRWLSFNHPFLRYANEAVYPFYILHQTVIIVLGYHLAYTPWSIWLKFPLVAAATFLVCWGLYDLVIRRWNPLRVVFGMKWQRAGRADPRQPSQQIPLRTACGCLLLLTLCSCSRPAGELVCRELDAPSLANNRLGVSARQRVVIYLPPSYRAGTRRYPVVYLLPNFDNILQRYTGGAYQGFRLKDALDRLVRAGDPEMLVVVPNTHHFLGGSWYRNSPLTGNWEDFVVKDLVGYVDREFRTLPVAEGRGLAGHGMGGFGALELALKHPDEFCAVYALSPALFDQNGLRDSGLLNEPFLARWQSEVAGWNRLEETARRKAFRDFVQSRLNDPSRAVFLEGLAVAYAAAVAPDLALPFPHIAFPIPDQTPTASADLWGPFEAGFGGWRKKLADYRVRGHTLKTITLEHGGVGEIPWIPRGVEELGGLMRAQGLPVAVVVHSGGHEAKLGQRLQTGMFPAMARALRPAP